MAQALLHSQAVTTLRLEMYPPFTTAQKSCLPEGGRKLSKIAQIYPSVSSIPHRQAHLVVGHEGEKMTG